MSGIEVRSVVQPIASKVDLHYFRFMGQNFFPDTVDQTLLFPPSLHEWLPEGHLARFLVDVVSALDLSSIYKSYEEKDGRGQAA